MNIMYVTTEFVTEKKYGGLATYLEKISQIFASRGHKVFIVVLSHRKGSFIYHENITIERVKVSKVWKLLFKLTSLIFRDSYKPLLWKYQSRILNKHALRVCQLQNIDIIQYSSPKGTAFYRIEHIPSVVRISSYQPLWRSAGRPNYQFDTAVNNLKTEDIIELEAALKADKIFGPSKLLAEIFQQKTGKKVDVIESPLPASISRSDRVIDQKHLKGVKYLLYFGTLNLLKGLSTIADSIYNILNKYPDLHFVLIGRASRSRYTKGRKMSDYILEKAREHSDRVHYIPFMKKENLFTMISNAHACVLPSRIDNLPNTCIEAMAMGKVVIGTKKSSFEQLIDDGENGFLSTIDSPKSLQSSIDQVMELEKNQLIRMGQLARVRAEKMLPDIIYKKHYLLYEKTIRDFKNDKQTT